MLQVMPPLIAFLLFAPPATPSIYERNWTGDLFGLSPGIYSCTDDAPSDIRAVDIRADGSFLAIRTGQQSVDRLGTWWLSGKKLELRFMPYDTQPQRSEQWEVSMGDLIRPVGKKRSTFSPLKDAYGEDGGIAIGQYTAQVPWRDDATKTVNMVFDLRADGTCYHSTAKPNGKRLRYAGRWVLSGKDLQLWLQSYDGKRLGPSKDRWCMECVVDPDGRTFRWKTGSERVIRFSQSKSAKG